MKLPYRGLSAFGEQDAALFFGRDVAAAEVLEVMSARLGGDGLAVVSGVSGAGKLTCAQAVAALLKDKRRWEIRSAGHGSKGQRWYAWTWIATASLRHLLIRRHLRTGELAFHSMNTPRSHRVT